MIGSKRVLGLIVARGGSKGVPRKNIRPLLGKPLIVWSIEAARGSRHIDRIVLSSDDAEIIDVAKAGGCDVPFVRPAELATDAAGSLDVVRHALASLPETYDDIVLLQPTSPQRTANDIDACLLLRSERGVSSVVTVCEVDKPPFWMFKLDDAKTLLPLFPESEMPLNRQAAPKVFMLNGAVYVARVDHIMAGGGFVAPDTVAWEMSRARSTDIDSESDFATIEDYMEKHND
jgi:CMP-N,N'-diacetyllegionaminic acid synthase